MSAKIGLYPEIPGMGGVGSFRRKFEKALRNRGITVTSNLDDPMDALLVLAGTKNIPGLWKVKKRGVPIVQRLDGINWLQRKRWAGLKYTLRAEYGNLNLAYIRRHLADRIVYQSHFVQEWWQDWYGEARIPKRVIYNAVDLEVYTPHGPHQRPQDRIRLLVVEGSLVGGLDFGLNLAVAMADTLSQTIPLELMIVGDVEAKKQARIQAESSCPVQFTGVVPRERIPEIDRSAHIYFSVELNSACPNAVIEALACGLPVVGFDTGALTELVTPAAGSVIPYGADPWQAAMPDVPGLAQSILKLIPNLSTYQEAARRLAEQKFGIDDMVQQYLDWMLGE